MEQNAGKITVEMTSTGSTLQKVDLYDKFGEKAYEIWKAASENFAHGASGEINAFVKTASPTRVYNTVEKPILIKKPDVKLIGK